VNLAKLYENDDEIMDAKYRVGVIDVRAYGHRVKVRVGIEGYPQFISISVAQSIDDLGKLDPCVDFTWPGTSHDLDYARALRDTLTMAIPIGEALRKFAAAPDNPGYGWAGTHENTDKYAPTDWDYYGSGVPNTDLPWQPDYMLCAYILSTGNQVFYASDLDEPAGKRVNLMGLREQALKLSLERDDHWAESVRMHLGIPKEA
jgi:hypothetical protein